MVAISVEFLAKPNIHPQQGVMELTQEPSSMDITAYLKTGEQLKDKTKAQILLLKAAHYILYDDKLYKRGYSMPLHATPKMCHSRGRKIHHEGNP